MTLSWLLKDDWRTNWTFSKYCIPDYVIHFKTEIR